MLLHIKDSRVIAFLGFLICCLGIYANDTLDIHINSGKHLLFDSTEIACKSFNNSNYFEYNGGVFKTSPGLKLLHISNNDSLSHSISLPTLGISLKLSQGNDTFISVNLERGTYVLKEESHNQSYLGLQGLIVAREQNENSFQWNLKEFQKQFNSKIFSSENVNFAEYDPRYFMVNGRSNPNINGDTLAAVQGMVGDTIYIDILNSGNSIHSLHFHGYHFFIENSNKRTEVVGWEKDTYGLVPGELLKIKIIPHQPGKYPVHDHNLVATTGNLVYPNGMFTTLDIKE